MMGVFQGRGRLTPSSWFFHRSALAVSIDRASELASGRKQHLDLLAISS